MRPCWIQGQQPWELTSMCTTKDIWNEEFLLTVWYIPFSIEVVIGVCFHAVSYKDCYYISSQFAGEENFFEREGRLMDQWCKKSTNTYSHSSYLYQIYKYHVWYFKRVLIRGDKGTLGFQVALCFFFWILVASVCHLWELIEPNILVCARLYV